MRGWRRWGAREGGAGLRGREHATSRPPPLPHPTLLLHPCLRCCCRCCCRGPPSVQTTAPSEGVVVYGMYIEGAGWDEEGGCLAESRPKVGAGATPAAGAIRRRRMSGGGDGGGGGGGGCAGGGGGGGGGWWWWWRRWCTHWCIGMCFGLPCCCTHPHKHPPTLKQSPLPPPLRRSCSPLRPACGSAPSPSTRTATTPTTAAPSTAQRSGGGRWPPQVGACGVA